MKNQLAFIQFLHPGKEHSSGEWNTTNRPHKRRFVKNYGTYLEQGKLYSCELMFWCEWEAQAQKISKWGEQAEPKFLWRPYYSVPETAEGLQNTDPFVFVEPFYYVCCQQWRKNRNQLSYHPTQLKLLQEGSVILFGSCKNRKFVLDTVFVVDAYQDLESLQDVNGVVPDIYKDVTLRRIFGYPVETRTRSISTCLPDNQDSVCNNSQFRLYFGATYEAPKNGMFSFFPCLPYNSTEKGFQRPHIELNGVVNQEKNQGFKKTINSIEDNKKLWEEIKQQVKDAGLKVGVYTTLPDKAET